MNFVIEHNIIDANQHTWENENHIFLFLIFLLQRTQTSCYKLLSTVTSSLIAQSIGNNIKGWTQLINYILVFKHHLTWFSSSLQTTKLHTSYIAGAELCVYPHEKRDTIEISNRFTHCSWTNESVHVQWIVYYYVKKIYRHSILT